MKFKKIISVAVGAVMLCTSLPFSSTTIDFIKDDIITAHAADEIPSTGKCGENVYYSLSDDGVLTISGSEEMYDYVIETNPSPFYDNDLIKSVIIEKDVSSIGGLTFFYCLNLTSIIIPDSVTSIDYGAFLSCTNLTEITIPDSVTSIDYGAFCGCENLTEIIIPDLVTSIGDEAFLGCSSLTSVTIPDSVTSIGNYAFYGCENLTEITIPNSVTSIGNYAFSGCTSLAEITIPNSVTSIGYYAFDDTKWLTNKQKENPLVIVNNILVDGKTCSGNVVIPNTITSMSGYTFEDCTNLTSVKIPDSVISIGDGFFSNCMSLTTIIIPTSVTTIGKSVFSNCTNLTGIIMPDTITSIGDFAFSNCEELKDVYYFGSEEDWKKVYIGKYGNESLLNATIHFNSNLEEATNAIHKFDIYKHSNDGETVIEVGNVAVKPSAKTATVPVAIFNNPGFDGTGIGYTYDERIKYSDITGGLIGSPCTASGKNYEAVTSVKGRNITEDGVLYCLEFKLPENAKAGDIFDISAEIDTFANENGDDVETKIYGGSISVIDDTPSNTEPTTEPTTEPSTTITTEESSETESIDNSLIYGDINSDEKVTIADAVLLNKYLVGSAALTNTQLKSADCLLDKDVNSSDTLTILKLIVGTYDSLPVYP